MRFGVDFGTTRTVVAYPDRGNYPLVSFVDGAGDAHDWVPSVVASTPQGLIYGFPALDALQAGAPGLRSFKRPLASPSVTPSTTCRIGDLDVPILGVVTGFLQALATDIRAAGVCDPDEPLEIIAGVPAHAHGAQRFLTIEAFRRAGYSVLGLVNEPSAASFEYTHRQARSITSKRNQVVVYDLGGGTFDASLVDVDGTRHDVVSSLGINQLGGDDFDVVLAACACEKAGVDVLTLPDEDYAGLLDEARDAKERIAPQSKRINLDVAGVEVTVPITDFYQAAGPLVEQSMDAMAPLVLADGTEDLADDVAGIYIVGGASGLPLVARMLRERFGRRVHRSPYPGGSTAIGLAIAADPTSGYTLTDRLSRGFGVFRELDAGRHLSFDPIVDRQQTLGAGETVAITRRYQAAHNVGRYLFVEYDGLGPDGSPQGDLTPFAEVSFPFDPGLQTDGSYEGAVVVRTDGGPLIEESYTIDAYGIVKVSMTDLVTGYSQTSELAVSDDAPS